MGLPETFFMKYCRKGIFFLVQGMPYNVRIGQKGADCFQWHGTTFGVEKGEAFERLEALYLESQMENMESGLKAASGRCTDAALIELVSFAYEEVIMGNGTIAREYGQCEAPAIRQLLKKDCFAFKGIFYELGNAGNGEASIGGRKYRIGLKCSESLEALEERYKGLLEKKIMARLGTGSKAKEKLYSNLAANGYYDGEQNMGFESNEKGFFIYTIASPYVLYEPRNNSYYSFPEAKAGTRLRKKRSTIEWEAPAVISPYMHPALPHASLEPFQRICNGDFNYGALEKLPPAEGIRLLMPEIRRMLQCSYNNRAGSWHTLEEKEFQKLKTSSFEPRMVTNK